MEKLPLVIFLILTFIGFANGNSTHSRKANCRITRFQDHKIAKDSLTIHKSRDEDNIQYPISSGDSNSTDAKPDTEMKASTDINSSGNTYKLKWYDMFANIPRDYVRFYHEDITWNKVPIYLGIAGLTAGLIATDNATWTAADKFYHRRSINKNMSDLFEWVGDGRTQFGLAGVFAVYGFIGKDDRALRTASQVVEAILSSGAVVQLLKHITGRQSPFVSTKPTGEWRFFPNQIDYLKHTPAYDAFPSGHLTTSLATLVVIAENYPEQRWIWPATYVVETLLAASMVNTGIHWYSDYPLAVFLGYTFGEIVSHPVSINKSESKLSELQFSPYYGRYGSGICLSFDF